MINAFYTGVSGMIAFQEHMNNTAHNIANVSTKGYKAGRSTFSDLIYSNMDVKTDGQKLAGHGVKNGGTDLMMQAGTLTMTGELLDFAIVGDGFFALENTDGALKYTRNGNFNISVEGRNNYLVSRLDGSYVLDANEQRIDVPVDESGSFDTAAVEKKLGVFNFENPWGLRREDGASFSETDVSGEPVTLNGTYSDYEIRGMTLENSSVDLANEMLEVIQAQRAFQMSSRIVQTADQMEDTVNNLR